MDVMVAATPASGQPANPSQRQLTGSADAVRLHLTAFRKNRRDQAAECLICGIRKRMEGADR
jgi:hypothetical protein